MKFSLCSMAVPHLFECEAFVQGIFILLLYADFAIKENNNCHSVDIPEKFATQVVKETVQGMAIFSVQKIFTMFI